MAQQGAKTTVTSAADADTPVPGTPVAAADVLDGGAVDRRPPDDEERAVLGEQHEDDLTEQGFGSSDEEDDDEDVVGSDSEFEEDDQPPPPLPPEVADRIKVARGTYRGGSVGAASVQTTVAFQRLEAFSCAAAAQGHVGGGGGAEIVVLYRYTRFLKAQSGGAGAVDTHVLGPKQARLRFHVRSPMAFSTATSLWLAGAALAPLVYPARFSKQLRALWDVLVCKEPVSVPPQTTHLVVIVDVGILRPEDYTPERMDRVGEALSSPARERVTHPAPAPFFDAVMEETVLHLPAPVEFEDDVRPAKRRRVTGEDCPICCEALERGLVAWPRCSHIFHGRCLEPHLLRGCQQCPMCRTDLQVSSPPVVEMNTM
ncbi:hypothetical protein BS78_K238600 [Paspalum vaginatum]|uniref:RING-type domain-containing protein n=1 Tax=Paspalum vaginatum TaxID=158149 RepID=A0A9W7XE97_9POAL|nr:hypothetical protein BS78_K238600 [Paspalum vaginatum]